MAQCLELNLPGYSLNNSAMHKTSSESICFCCLTQNGTMINLANCKHKGYLQEYFTMEYSKILVCFVCHKMLKNIAIFKKQVEECRRFIHLNPHVLENTTNKLINLRYSGITITSSLFEEEYHIKENSEVMKDENESNIENDVETNHSLPCEIITDIKIEHESSDFENDIPLAEIKKTKKKLNDRKKVKVASLEEKYDGKIKVVVLTKKELMGEREKESKKESYAKLPFKCDSCIKGFDHESTLKTHIEKQHMKKGMYRCDICNSVLGSEPSYKEHARRHFRRFECMTCGKRTTDIYSIAQHYNQQHGDTSDVISMQFSCDQCDFTTDSHRAYRYHREKHKQKQQCSVCGSTFVSSGGLRVHMNTVHKQSARVFKCSACDKTYKCKSGLFNHTASVHGAGGSQRSYCAKCRTHFATRINLVHHLRTHSAHLTDDSKRFLCDDCDARFLTKSALQTHIDWDHLKAVKYECNKCSKAFKTAVTLKRHHSFVHEKKRPPRDKICDYCGRGFTTSSILVSHIRTHTGERPLHCTHCTATFAHGAALYTHNKLIHNK